MCVCPRIRKSREGKQEKKVKVQEFMLQRIWNMKNMVIREIIGATGTATNGLKKSFEVIPGKDFIDLLTKTAVFLSLWFRAS